MNTHEGWRRVNKKHPCPICGHVDWCLVSDDGTAAICPRVESNHRVGEAGWLRRLVENHLERGEPRRPRRIVVGSMKAPVDFSAMARQFQADAEKAGKIESLAAGLGLMPEALRRFGVGWIPCEGASSWPMADATGRIIGINRRFADGSKRMMAGHKAGLYLSLDLPSDLSGLPLLIAEGATDAVAGLDLGFWTVGRFNVCSGGRLVAELVKSRRPALVVIVADRDPDGQGQRGAESLASALLPYCRGLKVILPPAPHKDLRAWRQAGATHSDSCRQIETAPLQRLAISVRNFP